MDVNLDCLEAIFMQLSSEDLVNIAHTNKLLKQAADLAFARKFCGKMTKIHVHEYWYQIEFDENKTPLRDLPYFVNLYGLLRNYGNVIRHIVLHHPKIYDYVNKYCNKSAIDLTFSNKTLKRYFTVMPKPFINAQVVNIINTMLNTFTVRPSRTIPTPLDMYFPNVRTLKLIRVDAEPLCFKTHFVHLQYLKIVRLPKNFEVQDIIDMLQLNPQLRKLVLDTDYLSMGKLSDEIVMKIVKATPLLEEFAFPKFKLSLAAAIQLTYNCKSLKKMYFAMDTETEFNDLQKNLSNGWQAFCQKPPFNVTVEKITN